MIFLILRWGIKKRLVLVHDFSSSPPCSQRCKPSCHRHHRRRMTTWHCLVQGNMSIQVPKAPFCGGPIAFLYFLCSRGRFLIIQLVKLFVASPPPEVYPWKNGWVGNRSGFLFGMEAKFSGASCWICRECAEFRYMFKKSQILCSAIDFQWCTKNKKTVTFHWILLV